MAEPQHPAGQLENIDEMSTRLRMSPTTIRRRMRSDPDFPIPLQRRGRLLWLTEDRLAYVALLARRARRLIDRREDEQPAM